MTCNLSSGSSVYLSMLLAGPVPAIIAFAVI